MGVFKVGDLVRAYGVVRLAGEREFRGNSDSDTVGKVVQYCVPGIGVQCMSLDGLCSFWAHPKQLRKLKPVTSLRTFRINRHGNRHYVSENDPNGAVASEIIEVKEVRRKKNG